MKVSFRKALLSDVEKIVSLVNSAFRGESSRQGWTTEADILEGLRTDHIEISEIIQSPKEAFLVGESNSEIICCLNISHHGDKAYLGMITVKPALQNSGVGRKLLEAAEKYIQSEWKLSKSIMTVITVRTELISWYERRGYVRTGKTVQFPKGNERFEYRTRQDLVMEYLEKHLH